MAVNGIGSPNPTPPPKGVGQGDVSGAERVDRQPSQSRTAAGSERGAGDQIDLSEEAQLAAAAPDLAEQVDEVPDVRPEKVEEARQLLASGFYNQDGAIEQTAADIQSQFQLEG